MSSCKIVIIGAGMVGMAVHDALMRDDMEIVVVDPRLIDTTIAQAVQPDMDAVFVCVPTPTDGSNFAILRDTIAQIKATGYKGLVIVKSTVLPGVLDESVVYNPEFLSRATATYDFLHPPVMLLGGNRAAEALGFYLKHTKVDTSETWLVDNNTAALAKYTMNSFYALKVTFMNEIYDVAQKTDVDYDVLAEILSRHPWMGSHHFMVPGPDGERGFGGPCLPKDTKALADAYDIDLLKKVLEINLKHERTVE